MTPELDRSAAWSATGTRFLRDLIDRTGDADLRQPSALPDWTRAHVIAHLARNADGLVNLATWARTGVQTPMYPSMEQRAADIEDTARLAPTDLRADFGAACDRLAGELADLPAAGWTRTVRDPRGTPMPASAIPWMRAREVWIHAVDLGTGTRLAEAPDEFVDALLSEVTSQFAEREEVPGMVLAPTDRAEGWAIGTGPTVTGSAAGLASWLIGRSAGADLDAHPGELPTVPAWL